VLVHVAKLAIGFYPQYHQFHLWGFHDLHNRGDHESPFYFHIARSAGTIWFCRKVKVVGNSHKFKNYEFLFNQKNIQSLLT